MFLFWGILGALIGYMAAVKRRFSPIAGVLGGLLLGPLAVLMFAVSGVESDGDGMKTCHFCKERIRADALLCKHCRQPARPVVPLRKTA